MLHTTPAQGEENIPTDVAILVDLELKYDSFAPLPSGLCTLRTLSGEVVPSTTERVAWWHAEVRPTVALAPNTTYELEVQVPIYGNSSSTAAPAGSCMTITAPNAVDSTEPSSDRDVDGREGEAESEDGCAMAAGSSSRTSLAVVVVALSMLSVRRRRTGDPAAAPHDTPQTATATRSILERSPRARVLNRSSISRFE